jgi:hypothetical protein
LLCSCGADGPRGGGGRSAGCVFFVCSSCSCAPFLSIRFCFRVSLQPVRGRSELQSRTVRKPRGRSAWSSRTVRFSRVGSRGSVVFNGRSVAPGRTVRVSLADCPRHLAGLSARPLRTVRPAWPDSRPEADSFVPWFDSSLLLSCFRVCFKESFLRLGVDP